MDSENFSKAAVSVMQMVKRFIIALVALGLWVAAAAQQKTLRAVTSAYTVEIGSSHIADTYLTPLHYRGLNAAFRYERTQAMGFDPERWTMQLKLGAAFDRTQNPTKNATMLYGAADASWAMMRRWRIPQGFTVGVGGATSLNVGVLYLSRNGNNPASAKAAWTVDVTGYAAWSGKIGPVPLTVRYQPTLPLTGAFFSPDYGQLYYQIYLGERAGLAHMAWPANYFMLDNLLTVDLHLGRTSLRLGYHGSVLSSKVNNIVTQRITHAFILGITTEWISLRPGSKDIDARIISSY